MSDWKPGSLIADDFGTLYFVVEVTANSLAAWGEGLHGVRSDGNGYNVERIGGGHPLVVIDPEDREQVELLYGLWLEQPVTDARNRLQAALRDLAAPTPKPDEPQGLGAVVEDAEGERWVRIHLGILAPWRAQRTDETRPYRYFKDVNAVRVLSEGVS